jgi:predicted RNase H-like nuclease (RuvC/YqgF family)
MLEMIKRKAGLNVVYWKINNTLEEIKQKRPDRTDLISSMEKSLTEVGEAVQYLNHVDKMLMATNRRNHELELENIKLKQENKSLNKHLEMLISGEI